MPHVDRFSVSLDTELLAAFDRYIAEHGYENRSEAVRDMIRELLVASRLRVSDEPVAALLTVVWDRRDGEASKRIQALLSTNRDVIAGSLHLAIDDHRDAVAIGMRGPADRVRALGERIQAMRGVTHGHLSALPVHE